MPRRSSGLARRPRAESLESRELLAAFVVTSAADSGAGSLRAAILGADADTSPGVAPITFAIPGPGTQTIDLRTPLPAITRPVLLDGTSQPGYVAGSGPVIAIDGLGVAPGSIGLTLSGGSTVRGLSIGDFRAGTGIRLTGTSGGNRIEGSNIGLAADGVTRSPNQVGIEVDSPNNTIGGTTFLARNLISGNVSSGVNFATTTTRGNVVQGNLIGTDATGRVAIANGDGIYGTGVASPYPSGVTIGGTVAGAGNVISGNALEGIGGGLSASLIAGNIIGLDATGTQALGNQDGIRIVGDHNTIGGTTAAARNVVSGNFYIFRSRTFTAPFGDGIGVAGSFNLIQGNYVGPDYTGKATVATSIGEGNYDGIDLGDIGDASNTVCGTTPGAGNLISGNTNDGLRVFTDANLVQGNLIGTDATGTAALGNGTGVRTSLLFGNVTPAPTPLPATTIGGTAAGAGNTIAFNRYGGIAVEKTVGAVNLRGNTIFGNTGSSISNQDPRTYFTSETTAGGKLAFSGVVLGTPGATSTVDVYANPVSSPSGNSRGQVFLGTVTATIDAVGIGHYSGSFAAPSFPSPVLEALVTGPDGNTLGFSPEFPAAAGPGDDLAIAASVSSATPLADNDVTLTFTVTNKGTTLVSSPTVQISLPAGLTVPIGFTPSAAGEVGKVALGANGMLTATVSALTPGQSTFVTVVATATGPGPLNVLAGVSGATFDLDYSNNEATATVIPVAPGTGTITADLGITGTASPDPTYANQPADFTLTVTNKGPNDATNVVVHDLEFGGTFSSGISLGLTGVTPSQGSVASILGTGQNSYFYTINLGTIAAGHSATIFIASTAFGQYLPVYNTAKVTADQYDPTPSDKSFGQAVTVNPPSYDPTKIAIAEAETPSAPRVGAPLTYTLTVAYGGNGQARYINVVDALPSNVNLVAASTSQGIFGRYDAATRTVSFALDPFVVGSPVTITILVTPTATGSQTNTAVVYGNDRGRPITSAAKTETVGPAITPALKQAPADLDGDGKTDLAVYLPAIGAFAYRPSSGGADVVIPFGPAGAGRTIPAVGDYTGSGRAEIAAYLPGPGLYAIRPASGAPDVLIPFGSAGPGQSIPAPADYEGSGKDDIAVYLPAIGAFGIRPANGGPDRIIPFGAAGPGGSIPAPADYFGTGRAEIAVYLPSIGAFAIRPPGGGADVIVPFGAPGAGRSIPIPGDYDGSGRVELAVYMPALGLFAYRPANGGPDVVVPFGAANSGSVPVVGDYDGSGRADLAVFDPTRALFAYRPANAPDVLVNFGTAGPGGSLPVAAPPATATPGGTVSAIGSPTPATTKAVPRGPSAVVSTRGLRPSRVAQSTPSANRTTGT